MPRPNIVYLHSHDTGRYIRPYGFPVDTPHLQRFAEQGVLFRKAFCVGPTCSPSRAALVTGQYPHTNGMTGLAHRGFSLVDYGRHLVHWLKDAGYYTVLAGHQHVAKDPSVIGYDEVMADTRDKVTENAVGLLENPPSEPFFLSVGYHATHRPFPEPDPRDDPRYVRPPAPLPDTERTRYDMACYHTLARMLDDEMGAVIEALDGSGLAENTLVIVTTDHGIAFPFMKCNLNDHGTGVMLMMRGPGGFEGGRVVDGKVTHLDIAPTLAEVLGIDPPAHELHGRSFMPLVRGEIDEVHEAIFGEVNYHAAYEPKRTVRTDRYRYVKRFDGRTRPVMPNCDDSPSKEVWGEHGWRERAVAEEALYDVVFDPIEVHNLADDPAYADVLADMRARLDRWMRETDDPLLNGPIAKPEGAVVNSVDGASAQETPE